MKQFLLFGGHSLWDTAGGWSDFIGDFGTIEAALTAIAASDKKIGWFQIVDLATGKQVKDSDGVTPAALKSSGITLQYGGN
jgi:hypothetical protein